MNNHSQKLAATLFAAGLLVVGAGSALATVRYVDVNSTNSTSPYTNWVTAATNIQDAVDAAVAGDEIVVTNGTYVTGRRTIEGTTTNRVSVNKPLSLRSVNGPQSTTIDGGGSVRCVYLTNGASLSGFTLTNGAADMGGGVFSESTNALVLNCVLTSNSAIYGGGAYACILNNCRLAGNSARSLQIAYGGGAANCVLNDCTLSDNRAYSGSTRGSANGSFGGGAAGCTLNNCVLTGNSAVGESGCTPAWGGGAYGSSLTNCTVTGNSVDGACLNSFGGGVSRCTWYNGIIYFNTASRVGLLDYLGQNIDVSTLQYCCTMRDPGGPGNITNAPLFVDTNGWANLRLQSNSPCINAGLNALAPAGPDLDGNPRISGGTVDIGAYELSIAPRLTILRSGENFVLTWPTNADSEGFTYLHSTTSLSPAVWVNNGIGANIVNSRYVVTHPISGTQLFFRLSRGCPDLGPRPGPDWVADLSSCHWTIYDRPGPGD